MRLRTAAPPLFLLLFLNRWVRAIGPVLLLPMLIVGIGGVAATVGFSTYAGMTVKRLMPFLGYGTSSVPFLPVLKFEIGLHRRKDQGQNEWRQRHAQLIYPKRWRLAERSADAEREQDAEVTDQEEPQPPAIRPPQQGERKDDRPPKSEDHRNNSKSSDLDIQGLRVENGADQGEP